MVVSGQFNYTKGTGSMPFLLSVLLSFQGSTHLLGVGSFSKVTYNFFIGDGVNKPEKEILKKCFNTDIINENQGSYKVSVEADTITNISPVIYQDIYGELWYVESPIEGLYLPEVCLHFLIISALCNIMRYSPPEWSDILSNRTSSKFSLVINQYIRVFERKFPLLITQYLSNYNAILKK